LTLCGQHFQPDLARKLSELSYGAMLATQQHPFAWFSRKTALKESRQTASLPYHRAAIFIFQGVATRHEGSLKVN
jgi:hypothetical protein